MSYFWFQTKNSRIKFLPSPSCVNPPNSPPHFSPDAILPQILVPDNWLADNQSRDLNNEFWLVVYLCRSVPETERDCQIEEEDNIDYDIHIGSWDVRVAISCFRIKTMNPWSYHIYPYFTQTRGSCSDDIIILDFKLELTQIKIKSLWLRESLVEIDIPSIYLYIVLIAFHMVIHEFLRR